MTLTEELEKEGEVIQAAAARIAHLEGSIEREQKAQQDATTLLRQAKDAQEILQNLAQAVQQQAHKKISEVVSMCLETVFEDPYQFHIDFVRQRGKTEARLRFSRRGLDVDPLSASGGGMIDVAAFALRAACLMLHRPRLSRLLVLDEPFKFVSANYRPNVRQMLEQLSEELNLQIIIVTHIQELETGEVVNI